MTLEDSSFICKHKPTTFWHSKMFHSCLWLYSTYAHVNPTWLKKSFCCSLQTIKKLQSGSFLHASCPAISMFLLSVTSQSLRNSSVMSQIWGSDYSHLPAPSESASASLNQFGSAPVAKCLDFWEEISEFPHRSAFPSTRSWEIQRLAFK